MPDTVGTTRQTPAYDTEAELSKATESGTDMSGTDMSGTDMSKTSTVIPSETPGVDLEASHNADQTES